MAHVAIPYTTEEVTCMRTGRMCRMCREIRVARFRALPLSHIAMLSGAAVAQPVGNWEWGCLRCRVAGHIFAAHAA